MKNLIISFFLILLAIGCGKLNDIKIKTKKQDPIKLKHSCSAAPFNYTGQTIAADKDIKLYKETVERVRGEIKDIKDIGAEKFWESLSADTRMLLNFELNMSMVKFPVPNPTAIYRATAYFFVHTKDTFQEGVDYKIKDTAKAIYSFTIRGRKTTRTELIGFKCEKFEPTDLGFIQLSSEVLQMADLKEVVECRADKKEFFLMNIKDTLIINNRQYLASGPSSEFSTKTGLFNTRLKMSSKDIELDIRIRNGKENLVVEWEGQKAQVKLNTPELFVDGEGACNYLKRAQ
jgi:hypothetical protein